MKHQALEETKQSIIHTYCLASDVADDTAYTAHIVWPKAGGDDGIVELAADGSVLPAGVIHHPGCKKAFKAGDGVAVIRTGKVKVIASGAIAYGDPIVAVAGQAAVGAAGDFIIGYAASSAANAGECIAVELNISKI